MNKLPPIPEFLLATPCRVVINKEGINEDGAPEKAVEWTGMCRYSDKASERLTADKKLIVLSGAVQMGENVAPNVDLITDGYVVIYNTIEDRDCDSNGKKIDLYKGLRPRNPDGSVHHTTLELI